MEIFINSTLFIYFSLLAKRKFLLAVRKIFKMIHEGQKWARGPNFDILSEKNKFDMVLTFRNSHNWLNNKKADKMYNSIFKIIKVF